MNQVLLTELEEAGYPFAYPLLEEVIELLGYKLAKLENHLTHATQAWLAESPDLNGYTYVGDGGTPKEAALRLWLLVHDHEIKLEETLANNVLSPLE